MMTKVSGNPRSRFPRVRGYPTETSSVTGYSGECSATTVRAPALRSGAAKHQAAGHPCRGKPFVLSKCAGRAGAAAGHAEWGHDSADCPDSKFENSMGDVVRVLLADDH